MTITDRHLSKSHLHSKFSSQLRLITMQKRTLIYLRVGCNGLTYDNRDIFGLEQYFSIP